MSFCIFHRQLETFDDFVDEAMEIDAASNHKTALRSNKRKVCKAFKEYLFFYGSIFAAIQWNFYSV